MTQFPQIHDPIRSHRIEQRTEVARSDTEKGNRKRSGIRLWRSEAPTVVRKLGPWSNCLSNCYLRRVAWQKRVLLEICNSKRKIYVQYLEKDHKLYPETHEDIPGLENLGQDWFCGKREQIWYIVRLPTVDYWCYLQRSCFYSKAPHRWDHLHLAVSWYTAIVNSIARLAHLYAQRYCLTMNAAEHWVSRISVRKWSIW